MKFLILRKKALFTSILLLSVCASVSSWSGGPACGPGYCHNQAGGCSPCFLNLGKNELPPSTTPTGIPVDSEWKRRLITFAQAKLVHRAWGFAHSERNYQLSLVLAHAESITLDLDVLLAASFLHDLGGLDGFAQAGVDHAIRSVELAEPLLREWGFPMGKWSHVKEAILGHAYYSAAPVSQEARIFRDADILDFLGAVGTARLLAVTEELSRNGSLAGSVGALRKFASEMPLKLQFPVSRTIGSEREREMNDFLQSLDLATFQGKAL